MTTPPNEPPQNPYGGPPTPPAGNDQPTWDAPPPPPPPSGPNPYLASGGQFSIGDALGYAWEKFKGNPGPFVLLTLLIFVASATVTLPFNFASRSSAPATDAANFDFATVFAMSFSPMQAIGQLLGQLVVMVLTAALVKGALDTTRGERVTFGSMFTDLPWAQVLIAGVLISIASTIGFFLCFLPGLIVMFLTMWTNYFIVGRGEDGIQAIKSSFELVRTRMTDSLVAWIVTFLVAIAGICLCCVGLLVTVPLQVLALGWSFRVLNGEQPA